MAQTPTPRSYGQILGDMIDAFLSRYGLRALKAGSPVLSILEATAQSQLRCSEDIFTLLDSSSLDQATNIALDRLGADEGVPRLTESPTSGLVNLSDTSFVKISTKVFQGLPAPIVGTTVLNVSDATLYPASGSVYIGRGTSNLEGPIAYTSKTNNGSYWTLNLGSGTLKFHNLNESVVLAQGGDRTIAAGSIVQTPQGNTIDAVQFKTLYKSTIPDGETGITGVYVISLKPGIIGNVTATAINAFGGAQFTGAAVSNPLPFNNGLPAEDDSSYRDRIRNARQSRARGTPLAITTFATGIVAVDENKRVVSAALVARQNTLSVLYIDDGTGYEERSTGVAIESLTDLAIGGEDYFKMASQPPVTKAFASTGGSAPFALTSGMKLAFAVGGVVTEHTFNTTDFRAIGNATAYEVVASINADALLLWSARTINGGTQVAVFAKADTNESIQNTAASTNESNGVFQFSSTRVDTMRLYKNDRLLSKDGKFAKLTSTPISNWTNLTGTQTLVLAVDGITLNFDGSMFPGFTATDFVNAGTAYTVMGANSPAAWASVFSYRIPGITASVVAGQVVLTSNRGLSATSSVQIISGTLVSNHMFNAGLSTGSNSDYILNRNTGEIHLPAPLTAGDKLSAGTATTRAFTQSSVLSTVTLGSQANLWFSLDGAAAIVSTGLSTTTGLTITNTGTSWGFRTRVASTTAATLFTNVKTGDWVVFWDATMATNLLSGTYRVAGVDAGSTWFEVERKVIATAGVGLLLTNAGISFVRSLEPLQKASVAAGTNYTASSFQSVLSLLGGTTSVYRTNTLRVSTNTFSDQNGDVALVAADVAGKLLAIPITGAVKNLTGHMASVESSNAELGVPDFHQTFVNSDTGATAPSTKWSADPQALETDPSLGGFLVGLRNTYDAATVVGSRQSNNYKFRSTITSLADAGGFNNLVLRTGVEVGWVPTDRAYFAHPFTLASDDQLTAVVDNDVVNKRYAVNMWRTLKPNSSTYAATNVFKDADNSNTTMAAAFGLTQDFNDFAVHMASRTQSDPADNTRTALWRWFRLGPDGQYARMNYGLPAGPNLPVQVQLTNLDNQFNDVVVRLSSGALTTGMTLRATTNVGVAATSTASGVTSVVYVLGFPVTSATRAANVDTLTLGLPFGITNHGLIVGNQVYIKSTDVNFASGLYTLTAVAATTISYAETAANAGPIANIGTCSFDVNEATMSGSTPAVAPGQFFRLGTTSSVDANFKGQTLRIFPTSNQSILGSIENYGGGISTTLAWYPLTDVAAWQVFANPAQTTGTIITAVNALTTTLNGGLNPIKGVNVGTGSGVQDRASFERSNVSPTWWNLTDGFNYVQTTTAPGSIAGDYQLSFKLPITAALATSSDWLNEIVRVIPKTAKNVVDWLNTPAVSGLFSAASVQRSSVARKVQIASLTAGDVGSVQVQGGTANSCAVPLAGSTAITGNFFIAQIAASGVGGLYANQWVSLLNAAPSAKAVFTSNTKLNTTGLSGTNIVYTLDPANQQVWTASCAASPSAGVIIEKQGNFIAITDTGLGSALTISGATEGDWVRIVSPATPLLAGYAIAANNTGVFRLVRFVAPGIDGHAGTIWIENPNATEQDLAECDISFFTAASLMVGDQVSISTSQWGTGNMGTWTVTSVGDAGAGLFTNQFTFKLDATNRTPTIIGSTVGTLGANSPLVQAFDIAPTRMVKRILSIAPSIDTPTLYDIKLTSNALSARFGAAAGTVMTVLNKLGFSTSTSKGINGYSRTTGLIAAANQVLYGDPSDPATYPGVISAGANINISGPNIRRIQVSVQLRVRSGAVTADIGNAAKSAIAQVINSAKQGQPVSISDYLRAAGKVSGVTAVVPVSPALTVGNDLIAVQPYEKARVLDLNNDITVTFVGA